MNIYKKEVTLPKIESCNLDLYILHLNCSFSTAQIVHQWSHQGVTIKKLLEALKKMEREDVVQSAIPKILEDCENVGTANAQDDLRLLTTTREIWTYQVSLLDSPV